MKRLLQLAFVTVFALLLPLAGLQARDLPSQAEVEAAVRAGHYSQAEALMQEVVQAKPASAKARYVYAEILAHNRQYAAARTQLQEARRLDPAISFADAGRVSAFEQQLDRAVARASQPGSLDGKGAVLGTGAQAPGGSTQAQANGSTAPTAVMGTPMPSTRPTATPARQQEDDGFPSWLLIGGGLVIAFLVIRALVKHQRQVRTNHYPQPGDAWSQQAGTMGGGMGGGMGGMVPPGTVGTGGGSALRTGMAVAGGVAAGMVLERMLHGNEAHAATPGSQAMAPGGYGPAQDELGFEDREIDFGRGNGWGGEAGGLADGGGDGGGGDGGGDGGGW